MQPATDIYQDLVFVGGGHAHALALRMLAMGPIAGLRITLISPSSHTPYSGMLPGLIAGHYRFEDAHIDLSRLCQWAGVRFIQGEVTAIDPQRQLLSLAGRPAIAYDTVSLDIGSQPQLDDVPGARDFATPVKPVASLWQRWLKLQAKALASSEGDPLRVAIVGGGAGSVELAMAMATAMAGLPVRLELCCGGEEILQGYNRRARASVEQALVALGVDSYVNSRVEAVEQGVLVLADGARRDFDELFWCTGAAAAPWLAASGLATDTNGFLAVRDTLQSIDHDNVFGAGDIATQRNYPRPKAGVYAVRQAPVLAHNLRNLVLRKPLKEHRPQSRFLSLISLGGRTATADRGPFSATAPWVWRWKDQIDRKFMDRFTDLPWPMTAAPVTPLPGQLLKPQAPCGGCGAKIGADILTEVLADLAEEFPRQCPQVAGAEDIAPIPSSGSAAGPIVQSIDVLRPMLADPWLMGRIAVNHALSDLYASGAKPLSVLAAITLPFAEATILRRELKQVLAGALYELAAVDCPLLGGHSMQGPEMSLGFVVNGALMSAAGEVLGKTGLEVGDELILTKPIGTGTLFAAHMQLAADGRDIETAVANMLQSNAAAGRLAVEYGASACTDITGFGLLGHLLEMLGSKRGAQLDLPQLPLLPGALESIRAGIFSTMQAANSRARAALGEIAETVDPAMIELLFDPQTSGGLLLGIAPDQTQGLLEALRDSGCGQAQVVGRVTDHSGRVDIL